MATPAELAPLLRECRHLVVFTGAGVSAESGIPTFRDALTGLWQRFDPADLATPEAFARDPELVWGWYEWRRMRVLQSAPNPAHLAIAQLAGRVPRLTLITQNVDDLHERAGSTGALHLHGSLLQPRCRQCGSAYHALDPQPQEPEGGRRLMPPACADCGGLIRPGVVWFGESLPAPVLEAAFAAAGDCDLLLSIGTSGQVWPAAQIPLHARQSGAAVLHLSLEPMNATGVREYCLAGSAGEQLPALVRAAFPST